jgi:ABC-type uncharacterized transport system ATPase subunit
MDSISAEYGVDQAAISSARSEPVVSVRGLVKRYGSHQAVAGIDLEVRRGEVFAFLGPNGAGKTTPGAADRTSASPTASQQYQAHFGLVYLDLEPEHLTQERGSGRKIVNLQVGAGNSRTQSPQHATAALVTAPRAIRRSVR